MRISLELVDFLTKTFPERCIRRGEDIREAERYAGKVELAYTIIQMAKRDIGRDIEVETE